jgi:hypothetical protein
MSLDTRIIGSALRKFRQEAIQQHGLTRQEAAGVLRRLRRDETPEGARYLIRYHYFVWFGE